MPANLPPIEECRQQRLAEPRLQRASTSAEVVHLCLTQHICKRETLRLKGHIRPVGWGPQMEEGVLVASIKRTWLAPTLGCRLESQVLC